MPSNWLDNTFYAVACDVAMPKENPRVLLELDMQDMSEAGVLKHLKEWPSEALSVLAFNPVEGWCRDVSEHFAELWAKELHGDDPIPEFVDRYKGHWSPQYRKVRAA